jgi:heme exporter protein B
MGELFTLLRKELTIELRTGQFATLIFCLSVLISVLAGIGITSTYLDPLATRKVFPLVLWLVFIFSATIAMSRSFDYELLDRAIDGLLLLGVSPWKMFLAKFVVTVALSVASLLISFYILGSFCTLSITPLLSQLMIPGVLAGIGYSALATLLAGVASSSQLRGLLLPLILIPLLFPLFFGAIELTADALSGGISLDSTWLSLLIGLDVVYLALGLNLYEHVIRD